jgi:hypothetical protein
LARQSVIDDVVRQKKRDLTIISRRKGLSLSGFGQAGMGSVAF